MKVLMAEDLESVRVHLSGLLLEGGGIELRFLGRDASPVQQEAATWRPEVVILDINMRGGMALGVLEEIKKQWPGMAVVMSASFYHPYYRTAFLKLGADLYFDKATEWDGLIAFLEQRKAQAASSPTEDKQRAYITADARP